MLHKFVFLVGLSVLSALAGVYVFVGITWTFQKRGWTWWKQWLCSRLFNHLWMDPASGMQEILERNINTRVCASVMNWLDNRRISHCKHCTIVDEMPLKVYKGTRYCDTHLKLVQARETAEAKAPPKFAVVR